MSATPLLEDFAHALRPGPPGAGTASAEPGEAEAARLAAWEQGYKAGWDDAVRGEADQQARIGADFARTLQELTFTFHEARGQVIEAMEPLLDGMVTTLFPALLSGALAAVLREEIAPMAADAAGPGIELVLSPRSRAAVEAHLPEGLPASVSVVEEETLADGQAFVRAGRGERQVDLDGALARMRDALAAYFQTETQERSRYG